MSLSWRRPEGSTQASKAGDYCVVHATEANWIAYHFSPFQTAHELWVCETDEAARQRCEHHAAMVRETAPVKRA